MKKINVPEFKQTAQDKLEVKKGGGCIGCFGVPFFLAGIFMLLMSLQIIPVTNANEVPWFGWIIIFCMGLVFSAVGSGLVFGRNWISIDRTKRRIFVAWGLLKPMKGQEYILDNYKAVLLKYDSGDSDSPATYPVVLKSGVNDSELALCSFNEYNASLKQAMLLSTFLHLPLEDTTTDHHTQISPQQIKQNIMPLSLDKVTDVSPAPENMKCAISQTNDDIQISIPGPAFSLYHLIGLAFPVVILYVIGFPLLGFFKDTQTPQYVQYFFLGFMGLFFVLMPVLSIIKAFVRSKSFLTFVTVNNHGIEIKHKNSGREKHIRLAHNDIIQIDYSTKDSAIETALANSPYQKEGNVQAGGISQPYAPVPRWIALLKRFTRGQGVFIKSSKGIYSFGQGLNDEEIYHLYTLIKHYLAR